MIHFYNEIVKLSKAKNFHRTVEYDNIIVCRYCVYIIRTREFCSVVLYIIPIYLVVIAYLLGMRAIGVTIVIVIIFGDRSQLCKIFTKTKSQQFMFKLIF